MVISSKKLKQQAKNAGINIKSLFPRTKLDLRISLNAYQVKKIKAALKSAALPKNYDTVLSPDRPEHYAAAGFVRYGKKIYPHAPTEIHITQTYKHEGSLSFYRAYIFGGVINAVLCPLLKLAEFLEKQILIDNDVGKFYDKVTVREGDRNMYGSYSKLNWLCDSAEELLLKLEQYKRHGSLIGGGGSFDYIQICFISFS